MNNFKKGDFIPMKSNLIHFLTPYRTINLKWIKDLNARPETIKLLEVNTDNKIFDISLNSIFLGMFPQARARKGKIDKWDSIKLKTFCIVKEIINRTKAAF